MPCAASPPSTFCQEKVVTSSLSQGRSMAKAAEVASQMVRPSRSAAIQSPFGTFTPQVVPFHRKTMSRSLAVLQVGQLAVGRLVHVGLELELLDRVGDPVLAESFPRRRCRLARAQQRPHRHFHGAGVGGRHDADAIIGGNAQQLPGALDRVLELGLAGLGAVGASHQRAFEGFRGPAGALGAGSGRKKRPRGTHSRIDSLQSCRSFLPE